MSLLQRNKNNPPNHKYKNKNRNKIIRGMAEAAILAVLAMIIFRALFVFKEYKPYDKNDKNIVTGEDNGFIAISYLAVSRNGTPTMISTKRLDEHLKVLYDNGYVTITQEDIENYYNNGTPLPEKSLFLMFEDGRRDTAIFAQKIMEKYNNIGTILSYADKFDNKDSKFLSPKDLLNLEESSFWELGTNGYRLTYINVFDRYNHYLGVLSTLEYSALRKYLGRNYNQYLMDFIRDENQIPKESYDEMKNRVSGDYDLMDEVYTRELGKLPAVYVLMHSNTGSYANNEKVSAVNQECMTRLFAMNFNREGNSYNNNENDIYDLTRMQPQAYWYPNHLLMRIYDDTGADIKFEDGDLNRKKLWETINGAAEYRDSVIALTSVSEGNGLLRLKESKNYKNIKVSVSMIGNKLGSQAVYLRADDSLKEYVSVKLQNNFLIIEENKNKLINLDLNEFDGIEFKSEDEMEQEALTAEYKIYKKGSKLFAEITEMEPQEKPLEESAATVEEGADKYIPELQINEEGNRKVDIILKDNDLTVMIDNKTAVKNLALSSTKAGYVYLESAWGEYGYSQRNIADDVYDGVFQDMVIQDADTDAVLYDNRLQGWEKVINKAKDRWDKLINWFINTL